MTLYLSPETVETIAIAFIALTPLGIVAVVSVTLYRK